VIGQTTILRYPCILLLIATVTGCNLFPKGSDSQPEPDNGASPQSPAMALTEDEYNNSVRDLFSLPLEVDDWPELPASEAAGKNTAGTRWPWRFPVEEGVDGYVGMALGQPPSPTKIEEFQKAAGYFSQYALVSETFFTCKNFDGIGDEEQKICAWKSLWRFAQRAYRRTIDNEEEGRLRDFFDGSWSSAEPLEAVIAVVSGILQSPSFIYRIETTSRDANASETVSLNHWELAAKLSYFLWDSIPDRELFAAAASCDNAHETAVPGACQLDSRQEVALQAKRMLADPRARTTVLKFHKQWLEIEEIRNVLPARRAYGPLFGILANEGDNTMDDATWPSIVQALHLSWEKEAELFIEKNIFDGSGKLSVLLSDNHGYFSAITAPIYGDGVKVLPGERIKVPGLEGVLKGAENLELQPAEFPKEERAGVLTLPAILAVQSHPVHPASILRGVFINKRLLCRSFGQPPAEAFGKEPSDSVAAESTNRNRVSAITSPSPCSSCHTFIDPPGFAFENYDSVGRYRKDDNGFSVDATGEMVIDGKTVSFSNGVELAIALSRSTEVRDCYVRQWASYAVGSKLSADDPGLLQIKESFNANDNILDLLVNIASSGLFRSKKGGDE